MHEDQGDSKIAVSLSVRDFDLHEDFDQPEINALSPLREMFVTMVRLLSEVPCVANVRAAMNSSVYPGLEFPNEASIEVVLCSTQQTLHFAWDTEGEPVGLCALSGGPYEEGFATQLRVIIPCDEQALREHMLEEQSESIARTWNHRDSECNEQSLDSFLITLTHEIEHALDFIRYGGGLTPRDIDTLSDAGVIDFDLRDAISGGFMREDMRCLPRERHEDIMEHRVESAGRHLFHQIKPRLDPDLYRECLEAYAPEPVLLEFDHDSAPGY